MPNAETTPPLVRASTVEAFDAAYGGLAPGEVAILACNVRDAARHLALDFVAGGLRADAPRGLGLGQVLWYSMSATWSSTTYEAEVRARIGEHVDRFEIRTREPVLAPELSTIVRSWATAERGRITPTLVIIEVLEDLRSRGDVVSRVLKPITLARPMISLLILSDHAKAPTIADYDSVGEAIDFLLWLHAPPPPGPQLALLRPDVARLEVRKARNGRPGVAFDLPVPGTRRPSGSK